MNGRVLHGRTVCAAAVTVLAALTLLAQSAVVVDAGRPAIVVFAASSLTDAMQLLGADFSKSTGIDVKLSFAASSALARQIESGAPADVFFSADIDWMDYLQKRNLIQAASRHDVLGNRLVLIAPSDSAIELKIKPHFPLAIALGS